MLTNVVLTNLITKKENINNNKKKTLQQFSYDVKKFIYIVNNGSDNGARFPQVGVRLTANSIVKCHIVAIVIGWQSMIFFPVLVLFSCYILMYSMQFGTEE